MACGVLENSVQMISMTLFCFGLYMVHGFFWPVYLYIYPLSDATPPEKSFSCDCYMASHSDYYPYDWGYGFGSDTFSEVLSRPADGV